MPGGPFPIEIAFGVLACPYFQFKFGDSIINDNINY